MLPIETARTGVPMLVYARWGSVNAPYSWLVAEADAVYTDEGWQKEFRAVSSDGMGDWANDPQGWWPLPLV